MMQGSVDSFETFGLVDGPGIRTVVFLNGCSLRCKYCHNPEMWNLREKNCSVSEVIKKVLRSKPYFKDNGGVTFSGGEPLIQYDFLLACCRELKKNGVHIAIDTAGITNRDCKELFSLIDMVLLDVKHITKEGYLEITQKDAFEQFLSFVADLNQSNIEVWIRQVIVPGIHDSEKYIYELSRFLKKYIKNVTRVDFLPYHKLGSEKYVTLGVLNPYLEKEEMNKEICANLYKKFLEDFKK